MPEAMICSISTIYTTTDLQELDVGTWNGFQWVMNSSVYGNDSVSCASRTFKRTKITKFSKLYNAKLRILPNMMVSPCSSFQYHCKARNWHNITYKHAVVFKVMTAYILASHNNYFGEIYCPSFKVKMKYKPNITGHQRGRKVH
jgi:hypothetical protein